MRFGNMRVPRAAALLAALYFLSISVAAERIYTIRNHCPATVKLFINGKSRGLIKREATVTKAFPDNWHGYIYSDANGGRAKGGRTTKAGFFGETSYYYLLKDPKGFNMGISVQPSVNATNGFCPSLSCAYGHCTNAYVKAPKKFPGPDDTAPNAPLFACPGSQIGYEITFCPSGAFPHPSTAIALHPNGNPEKCLEVRDGIFQDNTPVQVSDCDGESNQKWVLSRGKTTIQVAGTPYCLDAGTKPEISTAKICYCSNEKDYSPQTWNWDATNAISRFDSASCLDLKSSNITNANEIQNYPCDGHPLTQIWTSS
ncbi:hypothetical protein D9619_011623 [Psilocybe cf. subviscida]|uniref:Ricin B lectin domain-containing protein n=1 Tax=Psilocybe cf. subviscida TaxID=2480587 RepID=A0A8H5BSJ2_9AGAR|nr:hypothetical protein D9619_011623 [Psilocybe cf. subviscida]